MSGYNDDDTRRKSQVAEITSGSSSTVTGLSLNAGESLQLDYVKVEYKSAAGNNAVLEIYDADEGDASGDLNNYERLDKFYIQPGDRIVIDDARYSDVEEDVVLLADGSTDDEVTVTTGGEVITG